MRQLHVLRSKLKLCAVCAVNLEAFHIRIAAVNSVALCLRIRRQMFGLNVCVFGRESVELFRVDITGITITYKAMLAKRVSHSRRRRPSYFTHRRRVGLRLSSLPLKILLLLQM